MTVRLFDVRSAGPIRTATGDPSDPEGSMRLKLLDVAALRWMSDLVGCCRCCARRWCDLLEPT